MVRRLSDWLFSNWNFGHFFIVNRFAVKGPRGWISTRQWCRRCLHCQTDSGVTVIVNSYRFPFVTYFYRVWSKLFWILQISTWSEGPRLPWPIHVLWNRLQKHDCQSQKYGFYVPWPSLPHPVSGSDDAITRPSVHIVFKTKTHILSSMPCSHALVMNGVIVWADVGRGYIRTIMSQL